MQIVASTESHLETLKLWVKEPEAAFLWGGPGLRHPFTYETFLEDIYWGEMPSYSLVDKQDKLLGFGQYYSKHNRCHLARLIIGPESRRGGYGKQFFLGLMELGMAELGVKEGSLFVLKDNEPAIKCYQKLGFVPHPWPQDQEILPNIMFMIYQSAENDAY